RLEGLDGGLALLMHRRVRTLDSLEIQPLEFSAAFAVVPAAEAALALAGQLHRSWVIAAQQPVVDDELERQLVEVGQFDTGAERRILDATPHAPGQVMQGPHRTHGLLRGLTEALGELTLELDVVIHTGD